MPFVHIYVEMGDLYNEKNCRSSKNSSEQILKIFEKEIGLYFSLNIPFLSIYLEKKDSIKASLKLFNEI